MTSFQVLKTERLLLRQWRESDYPAFAKMNADERVMRYFPATLSRRESDAVAERMRLSIEQDQMGFFAAELVDDNQFIGFIGLNAPSYPLPFSPCVEIGWRLLPQYWGQGLASEGAIASLNYGFQTLNLEEIWSITPLQNQASERVMQKIGMQNSQQNFAHPLLGETHTLSQHLAYRITAKQYSMRVLS